MGADVRKTPTATRLCHGSDDGARDKSIDGRSFIALTSQFCLTFRLISLLAMPHDEKDWDVFKRRGTR